MGKVYKVNVYGNKDLSGPVVARVQYNESLDYWNGKEWSNGGKGKHLGITKLRNGDHVLIHGNQWTEQGDYGVIVSDKEALEAIVKSQKLELLKTKKFKDLSILAKDIGIINSKHKGLEAEELG